MSKSKHLFFGGTWKDQNCIKCGAVHYLDHHWTIASGWNNPCPVDDSVYESERQRLMDHFLNELGTDLFWHIGGFVRRGQGYIIYLHYSLGIPASREVSLPQFQPELICARWRLYDERR